MSRHIAYFSVSAYFELVIKNPGLKPNIAWNVKGDKTNGTSGWFADDSMVFNKAQEVEVGGRVLAGRGGEGSSLIWIISR